MADLMNPYANPYLPSFVNQRPRVNDVKTLPQIQPMVTTPSYSQIRSVNGFDGARNYASSNLAPGASDIVAESDPNIARVYIVAKDSNGQTIVEGYRLIHEEEPKPVTMDDLNSKMSELLDRMNKLEEERYAKPGTDASWKNAGATASANSRSSTNGSWSQQSAGGTVSGSAGASK